MKCTLIYPEECRARQWREGTLAALHCWRQADRQVLQAVDKVGAQAFHRAGAFDRCDALHQFFEQDAHFHSREAGAEAEVRATAAKGYVLVGCATDIEGERVGKNLLV